MADQTWAIVIVTNAEDNAVLAEGVVGFERASRKRRWRISNPPARLTVLQAGVPAFVVVQDLKGGEIARLDYTPPGKRANFIVSRGDTIRLHDVSFAVKDVQ